MRTAISRVDCLATIGYSVYTMRQASRRDWRIGQSRLPEDGLAAYGDEGTT